MSETFFNYALGIAAVYALCGMVYAVVFQIQGMGKMDPAAEKGTWGFRVLVMPGLVALWPLFFFAHRFRGASALSLRRSHRIAIIGLAVFSAVLFVAALAWRSPGFGDLPVIDTPLP
jgi:ABC-type amino acid transport system permease subunit